MLVKPLPNLYRPGEPIRRRCRCGRALRPRARGPRVWAPRPKRIIPHWRGGVRSLNMAAGDALLDADGYRYLDSSGYQKRDDGAGCTECCADPCVNCPSTAEVTFSGTTPNACDSCGFVSGSGTLSGTFTLNRTGVGPPCGWRREQAYTAARFHLHTYDEFTPCGGSIFCSSTRIEILLARVGTNSFTVSANIIFEELACSDCDPFAPEFSFGLFVSEAFTLDEAALCGATATADIDPLLCNGLGCLHDAECPGAWGNAGCGGTGGGVEVSLSETN